MFSSYSDRKEMAASSEENKTFVIRWRSTQAKEMLC